ncbi:hypothetical protein COT82_02815 [Candidatus Campbellbacteria bacterium CG10_big_fil_rev_8_21_14_0_10_35_52]|uniref:Cohesin domain-containing protein n=1 Tax=Candidatus Campbellbacteria bacterium CG10_big_fil_rev_8_21_14_0_10_35_52 TaxID=1974527 RepID=A0A2M6WUZ6_9BACT|nr:MAG: hypothetical protein COT82_02815 [Candidatus Campbellbacteria bacterium CG10_big_fil_rev_8_21_14_0_10_35_52]
MIHLKFNISYFIFLLLALSFCILFFPFSIINAATLNFSPPSGSYGVGVSFSVNVTVESVDQAMNAVSGVVSFPWDKLEVVSISKQGSILSLWPVEPSFSNSAGTVSFEGIALNPGYTGASGKILAITFRARNAGQANLSFSSGSVLANDGTGTNILKGLQVAVFTLTSVVETPLSPQAETSVATPNALNIISSTHPDDIKWYVNNTPEFSWELPPGALEARTLIGKSPTGNPFVSYIPPINKKKVDELPDGTYYFSLQVRTSAGWNAVSRYRVNIDTTPPKPFSITFPHGDKGFAPQPVVFFKAIDNESGISHYDIKIGDNEELPKIAPDTVSNPYLLTPQLPGKHTLFVFAIDRAGNIRSASAEFTIKGIDMPIITYYQKTINVGDTIKIRGTTYPNSYVNVYIREGDRLISEENTKSDATGNFVLVVSKRLDSGVYTFTTRVIDERGAQSTETPPFTISVQSEFVIGLVNFVLKYLSMAILALLVLSALAWGGVHLWFRISRTIARMRHEAQEAEMVSKKAFKVLREGVANHVTRLKKVKRKLTEEESEFLKQFEQKLEEAEELVTKEIQDISHS